MSEKKRISRGNDLLRNSKPHAYSVTLDVLRNFIEVTILSYNKTRITKSEEPGGGAEDAARGEAK